MGSRRTWAVLARIVPVLFSTAVWICVWGLLQSCFYALLAVGLVAVCSWESPRFLRWRFGVRPAADHEAAAVLEALVPAAGLRGRRQPRVWIGRPGSRLDGILALTATDVAVPELTVVALLHSTLNTDEFCASTVWTLAVRARRGVGRRHAALEVFCLPASGLSVVSGPARAFAGWPLIRVCWAGRGLVGLAGLWQSLSTDHVWAGVGAVVVVALSYAHPWCCRRRDADLVYAGDHSVLCAGLGQVWARLLRRRSRTLDAEARIARLEAAGRG